MASPAPVLQAQFRQATALFGAGRLGEAEQILLRIVTQSDAHGDAWSLLGAIAHRRGQLDQALTCVQKSIAANPRSAPNHVNLGALFFAMGQIEQAETSFRRALKLKPGDPVALNNLSNAQRQLGRPEEAETSARIAVTRQPKFPEALVTNTPTLYPTPSDGLRPDFPTLGDPGLSGIMLGY